MRKIIITLAIATASITLASNARADFTIASAIVEFTADGPRQQDVELVSRSKENDYIEAEISEVINPGQKDETRHVLDDPATAALLVTPDKTVLAGGGRKVLRFVLLKDPDDREHIYRVAIKPVINGLSSNGKIGLKILVGYEALVIVRPATPSVHYSARRSGTELTITNSGNTNVLFQSGKQCSSDKNCVPTPVVRVYPGATEKVKLPLDAPVTYSLWDGDTTTETQFE